MRYTGFFPYSLLPIPCYLFPVTYSLLPIPCSLKSKNFGSNTIENCYI
ncbi:MAG: hypothetical protein F6J90_25690 [Moorea sp. SIOASIH]|nr:hypothetical protein [Moorena sp. SIOASIH]NEO39542.1 hypothetical protein [Moorena sp. SIOASIH]